MNTQHVTSSAGVVFAGLLPHAPVLIPPIGGGRATATEASVRAMRQLAKRLVASQPDGLVVISPHAPRKPRSFGVWTGTVLHGGFDEFGYPEITVELPNDLSFVAEVTAAARDVGIETWRIPPAPLDHGALVPLWYMTEAGWKGPTTVLSLSRSENERAPELGSALAEAARRLGRRMAIVASGDMSHRLSVEAPAGYEPGAREFDESVVECLRRGAYRDLVELDPELVELAGEDVLETTIAAAAAVNWKARGHELLSYQAPFGVGYGVAILFSATPGSDPQDLASVDEGRERVWGAVLPQVARDALKAALLGLEETTPPHLDASLNVKRAVFVTIRSADGRLRGCVGATSPMTENILEETRRQARAAAFHDHRFPSVTPEELPGLHLEVSVLGSPEPVSSEAELDPARYGVVITAEDGRQGCLLPGLPEIRTAREQLAMARAKAGILASEPVSIRRFTAVKCSARPHRSCRPGPPPSRNPGYPCRWWTWGSDGRIECQLCPRACKLQEGQRGFCFVRQRLDDRLVLTAYGRTSGFCVDPIEKKPLTHFYPGTDVLSFGTVGCNLGCRFCQNWHMSKTRDPKGLRETASPQSIAQTARQHGCRSVAFTYNDPVISAEFVIDVASACHAVGVQTVAVTAGYMSAAPRLEFYRHIDAANIDLKGFTEGFYRKLCLGQLAPVLETLEYVHRETSVWLEVTSLLIPGENDDEAQLHWAADWFARRLGPDVPWHFSAFHPSFKMLGVPPTPLATLEKARQIALSYGLRYVYTGNVSDPAGSTTRCPSCGTSLIERDRYNVSANYLESGHCPVCHHAVAGRWN